MKRKIVFNNMAISAFLLGVVFVLVDFLISPYFYQSYQSAINSGYLMYQFAFSSFIVGFVSFFVSSERWQWRCIYAFGIFLLVLMIYFNSISQGVLSIEKEYLNPNGKGKLILYADSVALAKDSYYLVYECHGKPYRIVYSSQEHRPSVKWLSSQQVILNEEKPYDNINLKISIDKYFDRDKAIINPSI